MSPNSSVAGSPSIEATPRDDHPIGALSQLLDFFATTDDGFPVTNKKVQPWLKSVLFSEPAEDGKLLVAMPHPTDWEVTDRETMRHVSVASYIFKLVTILRVVGCGECLHKGVLGDDDTNPSSTYRQRNKALVERLVGFFVVLLNAMMMDPLYNDRHLSVRMITRVDEFIIDFSNTNQFAIDRWTEIVRDNVAALSTVDQHFVEQDRDWTESQNFIQANISSRNPEIVQLRRHFYQMSSMPHTMARFLNDLTRALLPLKFNFSPVWGLFMLNMKLSIPSSVKLKRLADWVDKLRRSIERFHSIFNSCVEKTEPIIVFGDVFQHLMGIMTDFAKLVRRNNAAYEAQIQHFSEMTARSIKEIDDRTHHISDLLSYSKANLDTRARNLATRNLEPSGAGEIALFPCTRLPYDRNEKFSGRQEEIDEMDKYLTWKGKNPPLRTFTVYGRRGVGKTEVALEYAYRNPSAFDAVFWVRCETLLSLRQSYTDIAIALKVPGSDLPGKDEENQMAVLDWLRDTPRRWLLIFDNAEKASEEVLKGYWPIGANGAIVITSRDYYNFLNHMERKGKTIKPFQFDDSWKLMLQTFDEKWAEAFNTNTVSESEIAAAKQLLGELGGLPLAITTAIKYINKSENTGFTFRDTYQSFLDHRQNLPIRHRADRSTLVVSLDTVFDMTFVRLGKHARAILSVLALLSPDEVPISLFLPRNQAALDGKLSFAKQNPTSTAVGVETARTNLTSITAALEDALDELKGAALIRWNKKTIAVHREIQEAIAYHNKDELQNSFDSAVHLVYEAFPKQKNNGTLFLQWPRCAAYISHAVILSQRYGIYTAVDPTSPVIIRPKEFPALLTNASWYLHETGDYKTSVAVVEVARQACENKQDMQYAKLCNTQGCNYFELNRIEDTRHNWRLARTIIKSVMTEDSSKSDLATVIGNLGNLECADGNYEKAIKHFTQAAEWRLAIDEQAIEVLGFMYLGLGRVYVAKGQYSEARRYIAKAEQLYLQQLGGERYFMAACYLMYGCADLEENLLHSAKRLFEAAVKTALLNTPVHPLASACYYKLGCCEFELGNIPAALAILKKAQNIAQLRSPDKDDGATARILWKTARILQSQAKGGHSLMEAEMMLERAFTARSALIASNEAASSERFIVLGKDDEKLLNSDKTEEQLEEQSFVQLIPGFWR